MRKGFVAIGALAVAGWLALAGTGPATGGDKGDKSSKGDKLGKPISDAQFVKMASASDLAELQLAQLALKQAQGSEVKQFAQQMMKDHTQSSKELLAIAGKKGLSPAMKPDEKHMALTEKLLSLKGAEFDRAYMKHMVMDHKEAVALFQSQADNGKDADLKAFAAKTLPVIQMHLKMAQEISGKYGK